MTDVCNMCGRICGDTCYRPEIHDDPGTIERSRSALAADPQVQELIAAEREACAKVAEDARTRNTIYDKARRDAAAAIRARGEAE